MDTEFQNYLVYLIVSVTAGSFLAPGIRALGSILSGSDSQADKFTAYSEICSKCEIKK